MIVVIEQNPDQQQAATPEVETAYIEPAPERFQCGDQFVTEYWDVSAWCFGRPSRRAFITIRTGHPRRFIWAAERRETRVWFGGNR